jgi:predicted PurR-regulated permease PerM
MDAAGRGKGFRYAGPLLLLGSILAFWFLLKSSKPISHIFFLGLFSIVLSAILDIPISFLAKRMPRWAASLIVLVTLALTLWGLSVLAAPGIAHQGNLILDQTAETLGKLDSWVRKFSRSPIMDSVGADPRELTRQLRSNLNETLMKALPLAFGSVVVVGEIFAVVAIAIFLVVRPKEYIDDVLQLVPKSKEKEIARVLGEMGLTLRNWTKGTLLSMTIIGTVTAVGLLLIGVEGWLPLAIIAFFGEFIPFAGPILSSVPALAVGLADSPQTALYVGLLYFGTQQLEGNVIQPLVMKSAVKIPPPLLILWQMLFAMGFGFTGLLIATPLLAVLQVAVREGYVRGTLGRRITPVEAKH